MSRRDGATPTERINVIVRRSFPKLAFTRPRKQEPTAMACDPDHIDLDRPEESGIGRATPATNMSIRAMCVTTHRAQEQQGVLVGKRTPAGLVGALLEHMSAECALSLLDVAARTARAVIEDEKPNEETKRP